MTSSKQKEKHRFIFPDKIAKAMKNMDTRMQLESGMLSMAFLLFGLCLMTLQILIVSEQSWLFKGLIVFNMICGFFIMAGNLVMQYQQYVAYMETMGIDREAEKKAIKAQGNFFKRCYKALKAAKIKRRMLKNQILLDKLKKELGEVKGEVKEEVKGEVKEEVKKEFPSSLHPEAIEAGNKSMEKFLEENPIPLKENKKLSLMDKIKEKKKLKKQEQAKINKERKELEDAVKKERELIEDPELYNQIERREEA